MRRCQKRFKNKNRLVFPPSAATRLKSSEGREGPGTGASERCDAGGDEAHSLTTASGGGNHGAPGKTYPDVLLIGSPNPRRPPPHGRTFMGRTWAVYHGGSQSSHFSSRPHLLPVCTSVRPELTSLLEDNKAFHLIRNVSVSYVI